MTTEAYDPHTYWTRRGHHYHTEHQHLNPLQTLRFRYQERHVIRTLRRLQPQSIVDVGAGYGRLSGLAHTHLPGTTITAIEPSAAQRRQHRLLHPNIPTIPGALPALPLGDQAADVVLCAEVLMHLPPDQARPALKGLQRIARRAVILVDWWNPRQAPTSGGYCWQHDTPSWLQDDGWSTCTRTLRPITPQRIVTAHRPPEAPA